MFPDWLHGLAIAALLLGAGCALVVSIDVVRHPQHMGIMNVVWPVTALFGTVAVIWAYVRYGRLAIREAPHAAMERHETPPNVTGMPFPVMVGKGALHRRAGCMLGDVLTEWLAFLVLAVAIWFGWQSLFAETIYAVWVLDFVFAFGLCAPRAEVNTVAFWFIMQVAMVAGFATAYPVNWWLVFSGIKERI